MEKTNNTSGLVFIGAFLFMGLIFLGLNIKYGIRTHGCLEQKMTPEECYKWEFEWVELKTN